MKPSSIVVLDYDSTCAAGTGMAALRQAITQQTSGLSKNDLPESELETWVGKVTALDDFTLDKKDIAWTSRNNRLIKLGLEQGTIKNTVESLKERFGGNRVGVVMGSSTSSIDRTEEAYRHLDDQGQLHDRYKQENVFNPHAPGLFVAHSCGLSGPTITVNTACSSSAKVFATSARWLALNIVDAVLVGGADTLCLSVLHGFHSLQLVSEHPCKPFDQERDGINLGEAAGFAVLVRAEEHATHSSNTIELSGFGESSDAHHMSHPHPDGLGAQLAIEQALTMSELLPSDIGYINLHGTASRANDLIEGNLIAKLFPGSTISSSTKGWMGHTLGAAGIMESIVAMDTLRTGVIPGTLNLQQVDDEIPLKMSAENRQMSVTHVMSNSFGFGGNNCCLIFSKLDR